MEERSSINICPVSIIEEARPRSKNLKGSRWTAPGPPLDLLHAAGPYSLLGSLESCSDQLTVNGAAIKLGVVCDDELAPIEHGAYPAPVDGMTLELFVGDSRELNDFRAKLLARVLEELHRLYDSRNLEGLRAIVERSDAELDHAVRITKTRGFYVDYAG